MKTSHLRLMALALSQALPLLAHANGREIPVPPAQMDPLLRIRSGLEAAGEGARGGESSGPRAQYTQQSAAGCSRQKGQIQDPTRPARRLNAPDHPSVHSENCGWNASAVVGKLARMKIRFEHAPVDPTQPLHVTFANQTSRQQDHRLSAGTTEFELVQPSAPNNQVVWVAGMGGQFTGEATATILVDPLGDGNYRAVMRQKCISPDASGLEPFACRFFSHTVIGQGNEADLEAAKQSVREFQARFPALDQR